MSRTCESCTRHSQRLNQCRLVAFFAMKPEEHIEVDGQTVTLPEQIRGLGWAKLMDADAGTRQLMLAHQANTHLSGEGPTDCPVHVAPPKPAEVIEADVKALVENAWLFSKGAK